MGGVGLAFRGGPILTVTDRADISAVGAEPDQVLPDGGGTLFAESEVVLGCAADVGVAGDDDFGVGIVAEIVGQLIEFRTLLGLDGETVVGEVDGFALERFVIGIVGIAGTLRQRLIINVVSGVTESGGIAFFVLISAPGEDGQNGY